MLVYLIADGSTATNSKYHNKLFSKLFAIFCVIPYFFVKLIFSWFYSVDQGFPKWAMTDTQGAMSSKGATGGA